METRNKVEMDYEYITSQSRKWHVTCDQRDTDMKGDKVHISNNYNPGISFSRGNGCVTLVATDTW